MSIIDIPFFSVFTNGTPKLIFYILYFYLKDFIILLLFCIDQKSNKKI
jgi:hypothetical protein